MTPTNTAELRALLEKATPGPWASGIYFVLSAVNDGTHKNWTPPPWCPVGRCCSCAGEAEPCAFVEPASADDGTRHVQRCISTLSRFDDDGESVEEANWHSIASESVRTAITGNYDVDVGGVCSSPADSALIVALRNAAPDMIEELEQARARIAELERKQGAEL